MKRIKSILMIALLLLGVCTTILQAQTATTVTLGGTSYPVIDLTELTPLGCILTKKECDERRAAMYAKSPDLNSSISNNGTSEAWNKKMSFKFQIMNNDYVSGSTNTFTWVDAWKGCKAYTGSSDGGGAQAGQWRLPTQKEYKMISVLYPQLLVQGGISPFAIDYYWSSTESGAKYAWHVYFSHGGVYDGLIKTNLYRVRCIRDL